MKMAPGREPIDQAPRGLVAGRPGRFWIPGGTMPPPCFLKSDGDSFLGVGWTPAPYKKEIPDPFGAGGFPIRTLMENS